MSCTKAPSGWKCRRNAGHEGPCAAVEELVSLPARVDHWMTEHAWERHLRMQGEATIADLTARLATAERERDALAEEQSARTYGLAHDPVTPWKKIRAERDTARTQAETERVAGVAFQQLAHLRERERDAALAKLARAQLLLKAANHLLLTAVPTDGDTEWEPTRARLLAVLDGEVADG